MGTQLSAGTSATLGVGDRREGIERFVPIRRCGVTFPRIAAAVVRGDLPEPFSADEVNRLLGIDWASIFLWKHTLGTPGPFTKHFTKAAPSRYRLRRLPRRTARVTGAV